MRQRLKQTAENQTAGSPSRFAENATSRLPPVATSSQLSPTGQRRRRIQARTYLNIGVFVLLVAFALFFNGIINFLNVPSDIQQDVNETLGQDAMHDFNLHFFMLVLYMIVASVYIAYSIFLFRNPATKKQPALLESIRKRMAGQTPKQRAISAWMARITTLVLVVMTALALTVVYRLPHPPAITLEAILTKIGDLICYMAIFGLNWIQAEVVSPLIPTEDDDITGE